MKRFRSEYQSLIFSQSLTGHHILLLDKCKSMEERLFYITEAATRFWSGFSFIANQYRP